MRRALPTAVIVLLSLLPGVAGAAERDFTLRYTNNVNGQITIAANTLMQCPTDTPDPLMNSGCLGTRDGTSSRNNNSFDMRWLDIDADPATFNSSSADLILPAGSRVLFAGLYWTGIQKGGTVVKGANGFAGVPRNPPNAGAIGTVKFRTPGAGGYQTVTASQVDTGAIAVGSGYTAFADVTARVLSAGPGTYTVADVQTGTGGNIAAGWSLVVAYSDGSQPLRNLSVFDGLKIVNGSNTVSIPLSGFKTPSSGPVRTAIGVVAAEGDAGTAGDYLTLNDRRLEDAVHPANNTQNSTIAHFGQHVTTKNPDWRNELGYDSSLFNADGFLPNNATTAMFRAKTSGDVYAPQAITFATELFSPNVTLTKTVSPAGPIKPGDEVTYTVTATNSSTTANAVKVLLVDPIPNGTTFVTGSASISAGVGNVTSTLVNGAVYARLGTGATATGGGTLAPGESASVTFKVTVDGDRPLGEVLTNEATLSFVAEDLGLPISRVASVNTTVAYPDPGIVKTLVSNPNPNEYVFRVTVTNEGTLATNGLVTVTDTVGAGGTITAVSSDAGSGWTCGSPPSPVSCTRSDALAAGASYPPITVTATYSAGAEVFNQATVAGGGEPASADSPAKLNNTSSVAAGVLRADLGIRKSALTGTVNVGSLAGYRITARNNGPSTAPNMTLTDELPAGLTFSTAETSRGSCTTTDAGGRTTVRCNFGSVPAGTEATVTIRAVVGSSLAGVSPVTNTATVTSDLTSTPASSSVNLTVRPATNLKVTKTASSPTIDPTVTPAPTLTYTVTVVNQGAATAVEAQVVDRLPAAVDLTTVSFTAPGGATCQRTDGVIKCALGDLAAGATVTIPITARFKTDVAASDRRALNRVNVFSKTTELDPTDNYAEHTVMVLPVADVKVVAGGPSAIAAGGEGTVTFTVINNGPSPAQGTSLTVTIPAGLTPIGAPAGCTISGQEVTCALGTMVNGASLDRDIRVRAAADLREASLEATARVSSTGPDDPVLENNTDVAPFIAGPVADLTLTKVADVAEVAPGGVVNYTLTITNAGPAPSIGAVVTDTLPLGMTVESATSTIPEGCTVERRTVRCGAGEITPNAYFKVLVVARVAADRAGATLVNRAVLAPGEQFDPNADNNTASATVRVTVPAGSRARLGISVLTPKRVKQGRPVRVRVRVTNRSRVNNPANDVRVCVTVPTRLRYVRSNGQVIRTRTTHVVRSKVTGKNIRVRRVHTQVCWNRPIMARGRTVTFTYLARARSVGFATPHAYAEAGNANRVRAKSRTQITPRGLPPRPTG